jgi:hypothetical protein
MRKVFFCLLFITRTALVATAQDTESILKRNIVKVTPQHFIRNTLYASYERFSPSMKSSVQYSLGLLYRRDRSSWSSFNDYETQGGVLAEVQGRYYVPAFRQLVSTRNNRTFAQGIYLSGFLRGEYAQIEGAYTVWNSTGNFQEQRPINDRVLAINPGFTIGYQRTLWQFIYFDMYLGGGLRIASISRERAMQPGYSYYSPFYGGGDILDLAYRGILPKAGISIGIGL